MIKMLSLFSGIGAFESALKNIGVDFEVVNYCEIDKYASKSYSLIHDIPESKNLKDVTKITEWDILDTVDLLSYGFPCQDISVMGEQKGFVNDDNTLTRSGLFFNALDVIKMFKPKVAIAENVKNLTSKRFSKQFKIVLDSLDEAGYNCYWQVLNAKDYGIPQNRERVFIVSIRKDIDKGFTFPVKIPLTMCLKDLLESEVNEKYYLSDKMLAYFESNSELMRERKNGFIFSPTNGEGIAKSITTMAGSRITDNFIIVKEPKLEQVGTLNRPTTHDFSNRVYSPDGLARTLMGDGGNQNDKAGQYLIDEKIRRLTPRECFRVMGFKDEEFNKLVGISDTQLYKQAGNSIVVPVLEAIFTNLYKVVKQ